MIEKRATLRAEKRVTYKDDTIASTSDPNIDKLSKNVDKLYQMMQNMVVTPNRNQNQNFRRDNNTPNRQKESDQQVIPPFQKFLDEDEGIIEESEGNVIKMFETEDSILNYDSEKYQPSTSYG